MSVGSQALERSALESKDRESLLQIATAMGGKPGSRAKKADIIDQILELAGVTTTSPAAPPVETAEPVEHEAAAPARRRGAERPANGSPRATDDTTTTAPDPQPARAGADEAPADSDTDGGQDSGNDIGNDSGQDDDAQGGQPANGSGPRDDGESGNRRRRRRGRDRNREAGQPAGAPAPTDDQWQGEPVEVAGLLDLRDEGYGFLRLNGYLPSRDDVYVSVKQVRQFGLRKGDQLTGASRPAARNEKNPALLRIDEVNGADPELNRDRRRFDELTAVVPDEQLRLESADDPADVPARLIDLIAPIGKGQRGLIVTPATAQKAVILKTIARAVEANHPGVHLMVVLVDERPEEVTDLRRSVAGEVVASTFDRPADEHTMVAELAIERAKRLVEEGKDVVLVLDGLTRLTQAYSTLAPANGRLIAGVLDASALHPSKRIFAAARKLDEGGSLTILAVASDTGTAVDTLVLDELSGAANLVLRLDAGLASLRIEPPIDVLRSGSLNEDQLRADGDRDAIVALRRLLAAAGDEPAPGAALELLLDRIGSTASNDALLAQVAKDAG